MDELHIRGTLSAVGGIRGHLGEIGQIGGDVTLPEVITAQPFEGPYTVIPRLYQQELATRGLAMSDDVTVKQIPVVYTSNLYDGKTVMIG